jgi:DNA-binding LacI/PurR family transcriptional regulator
MIIAVGGSPERERHALDQLRMRLADGAIIDSATIMADDLTPLMQANVALVVISNHLTAGPGFDVVRTTEAEASFEAALYLLDRGHRRIAFLGHSDARWPHYERFSSYLRALESRGIPIDDGLIRGGAGSREQSHAAAMELLRLPNRPAAILAASDIGAISVIWAARDLGLRVPEDVAVMGFGNIPEGEIVRPSLTTVGPVHLQFGDVAELLFSRLKGEAPPAGRVHHHPWALIRRGSA